MEKFEKNLNRTVGWLARLLFSVCVCVLGRGRGGLYWRVEVTEPRSWRLNLNNKHVVNGMETNLATLALCTSSSRWVAAVGNLSNLTHVLDQMQKLQTATNVNGYIVGDFSIHADVESDSECSVFQNCLQKKFETCCCRQCQSESFHDMSHCLKIHPHHIAPSGLNQVAHRLSW